MKTAMTLIVVLLGTMVSTLSQAADPADIEMCNALFSARRAGLFLAALNAAPQRVNGSKLTYDQGGRFYFVAASERGRPYRAEREMVWSIRLQTTAKSAKADETIVWRPPVKTECSAGVPLELFDANSRFVSLQRYYDHHASDAEGRRVDPELRRRFHLRFSKSASRPCQAFTDAREDVGDLRQTYGFEEVRPDPVLLARITTMTPAFAAGSIYSGLSSELAIVGPGEPVCFGFAAPLPTRSTLWTQVMPLFRHSTALAQAQSWGPERTKILIQRIPHVSVTRRKIEWRN